MSHEKAICAALEPIVEQFVALEKRLDAVQLSPGPQGCPGPAGAGIDALQWSPGEVYRKGTVVAANIGQHFVALRDTAAAPGDTDHWKRIGMGGFRHCGTFKADTSYDEGDLYVNGFSTFCVVNGTPLLLAGRGAVGKSGDQGPRGDKGDTGRDGSTIIASQVEGFKMVIVLQDADGNVDHLEADFTLAFHALVDDQLSELRGEIESLKVRRRA